MLDALLLRVASLEERIAVLEARPQLIYKGVWEPGRYVPGNFVTWRGSIWACMRETVVPPGDGDAWRLAVKRPRESPQHSERSSA